MAKRIALKHEESGVIKDGYYGFSWTTLFFGPFLAVYRRDFTSAIIILVSDVLTCNLASFYWPFVYNKKYTHKLLKNGFKFEDAPDKIADAKRVLSITP